MKKGILFFVLVVVSLNSYAQIHFPDSVKTDKEKAIYLLNVSKKIPNIKQSIIHADSVIKIAKNTQDDSLFVAGYFLKSFSYYNNAELKKSLVFAKKADSVNSKVNSVYYNYSIPSLLANIYSYKGDFDNAVKSMKIAIKEAEKSNKQNILVDAYTNIGLLFLNSGFNKKAKFYNLKALDIVKNNPNFKDSFFKVYINLIVGSNNLSELESYAKEIKKKINTYEKKYQGYFYVVYGDKMYQLKAYKNAEKELEKGMQICKETNFYAMINIAETDLGIIYSRLGKFKDAIKILENKINKNQNNIENRKNILFALSKSYEGINKKSKSLHYLKKYLLLNDSIYNAKFDSKFAEFDTKFKATEKDKEIAKQQLLLAKQENTKNKILIFGLFTLLLGYGIFQWIYNKQKRKKLTTENELQKELEINELRTKFLGNIAHEIRTPLTLIAGNLELAKENINTKDKAVQNIDVALTNSKKVVDDANEILELLKFEKSKITINQNVINLDTTLKRIFYSFKSLAELKKIDLKYQSVLPINFQIKTDVQKVEKILNNLISNALKYSPSNSKIIFYANIIDKNLVVKVTDFGQGIHFDETEKIFQRFYQASNSQSVGGIGIGLSLAKEFAELLNGNLSVKSELTKGSTFTFTLSITKVSEQNLEISKDVDLINRKDKQDFKTQQTTKQQRQINQNKPNILIVEDNPEMNNYLVEILSNNYNCFSAYDGLEALEKLTEQSFDLITSDIMMPNLNGFEFREKLNEIEKFKNIPFILISAKTLTEDKIKGFKLGIDDYVIKPFNKSELIARINNLLTHKEARERWTLDNVTLISTEESSDKKLLKKIENSIIENISDENFKIDDLAKSVGYSQRQLTRILKQYTGMSPVKFILEIRLQKAYANLQNKTFFALSEIRYDVGITSASYFNKKFKERFGIAPNDLLK